MDRIFSKLVLASTSHNQTPMSSDASSSTSPDHTTWDVFLSFRGIDTRYTFTDHLYNALDRSGLRTFRDDPELHSGEVISEALLQAIQESKVYVVVFSENYASSRWCLDELIEIHGCHESMGRLILPVFYNIQSSAVRHQIGSFNEAFKKHQTRFDIHRLHKWRVTLTDVANLSGYGVRQNMSEGDIINEIVGRILQEVNPKTLDVAKYPVGLDSRVKDITELLSSDDTEGVIRIGIYGMGGVGKTTLAKALYNQLLLEGFKGSCFLANVREALGKPKGLVSLQKQLINDILKSKIKVKVSTAAEGTMLIKERICSTKILVIIDDLDDPKQFESLVGPFASGSVVILTTRDEEILEKIEVEPKYRYMVKELNYAESLTLLNRHAFGNAKPNNTLMVLSGDILRHAGGLPLALEVFGSYLYKQSEVGWKSFIEKLQRMPNSSIKDTLIISLDSLESDDPMLLDIFLDIACFFIGNEKKEVVKILETYYSYADHNIDILKKRCLLTISNSHTLGMHDLLRDMGREIVCNNSPGESGKHSRLWVAKDIWDVLKNHKGTEAIKGIIPSYFDHFNYFYYKVDSEEESEEVSFTAETFKRMSKLRFLQLEGINVTGSFEQTFEDLRWLYWDCCPLKCFPSGFYPPKLVILELPQSKMTTMWEPNMVSQVFINLKTLTMAGSQDLTATPDFTMIPCLETLNLYGCESLKEVHISIGSLVRLVSLDLRLCGNLRILPDSICNLRALEVLSIAGCSFLEALPIELGNIESLRVLDAMGLTVSKLPDSIGNLSKLVELRLEDNNNLKTLPGTIGNLRSLENLYIGNCKKLEELPGQLWKITSLKKLDARGATLLKKLPDIESCQSALSLRNMDLSESGLTALPSGFNQLSNLEDLVLIDCRHLLSIAEFPLNLKLINADGCTSLEILPDLSNLKHLKDLYLTNCSSLTNIQGLKELTSITTLKLKGCNSFLLASTLTERFFQIYSGFGHPIEIYITSKEFPEWISESSNLASTVILEFRPNVWHSFLAIILCFKLCWAEKYNETTYSVKNTTSNFIWSKQSLRSHKSWMVIVPRSIFSVRDGDDRIELTANQGTIGFHLLNKTSISTLGRRIGLVDQGIRDGVLSIYEGLFMPTPGTSKTASTTKTILQRQSFQIGLVNQVIKEPSSDILPSQSSQNNYSPKGKGRVKVVYQPKWNPEEVRKALEP